MTDHHLDDHGDMSGEHSDEDHDGNMDHEEHPAELHFVALNIVPSAEASGLRAPFLWNGLLPPRYSGPIPTRDPDPDRFSA